MVVAGSEMTCSCPPVLRAKKSFSPRSTAITPLTYIGGLFVLLVDKEEARQTVSSNRQRMSELRPGLTFRTSTNSCANRLRRTSLPRAARVLDPVGAILWLKTKLTLRIRVILKPRWIAFFAAQSMHLPTRKVKMLTNSSSQPMLCVKAVIRMILLQRR